MTSSAATTKAAPKIQYLQWARAFGAIGIVVLHVFIATVLAVPDPGIGTERLVVYRELGMLLSRWCVPVFLMVSGTLLLDPRKDVGLSRLRRYVGRMLFVICTIGFVFALMQEYVEQGGLGWEVLGAAVVDVLFAQSWDHLWYLYAMVGLYALTPVLRAFVAHAGRDEFRWVLGFLVAFALGVPTANALLGWGLTQFYLSIPSTFVYYLLGYYVHSYLRLDRRWVFAAVACVAAMAVFIAWGTGTSGVQTGVIYAPESPLITVYAVTIFLALRHLLDAVPIEGHPVFATIARYSFGIYIVHPLFAHAILLFIDPLACPAGLYELVLSLVSLVGSIAVTWALKKLPGFRRVL